MTGIVAFVPVAVVVAPATPAPNQYDIAEIATPVFTRNLAFGSNPRGRILGTVKRKDTPANVPLMRRVRLYRDIDGMFIAETWSNDVGIYSFDYVDEKEAYTVIAYDYQHNFRAVIADNLTLKNGGMELI